MIDALNQSQNTVKTSIFYINDIHGQVPKMERIASAALAFDTFEKEGTKKTDKLKLCSGDTMIGYDKAINKSAVQFLDTINTTASTIGNHELDESASVFSEFIKNSKTRFLGMNMNFPANSVLKSKVSRSIVSEENGNKYGIIGIQPPNLSERIKDKTKLDGITFDDNAQTLIELQEEVNSLKKQGLNKIILLSHAGYEADKKTAQSVAGIDVILGGHSHELIKDIKSGENLFYSPQNEPVIITQAGRDGEHFGVLNLEFNQHGVITKAQNNVLKTEQYPKNLVMQTIFDMNMGKAQNIGILKNAEPFPLKPLKEENPYADFVCDALRVELDADIALLNSANLRGTIAPGQISSRDVSSITPFKNNMIKTVLSEKELVDAADFFAKSITRPDNKPGILQVSGLRYSINKKGDLTSLNFVDKKGNITPIDIKNPRSDKKYVAVYDDFLAKSDECPASVKKMDSLIEHYNFDKDEVVINHIKKMNGTPFEIKKDGRIKISD